MKKIIIFLFVVLSQSLFTQTNVDKVTSDLELLAKTSYDNWKISPDLNEFKPEGLPPFSPGYDDSKWNDLFLNKNTYLDSCWLRKEILLPSSILGKPLSGKVKLLVSVDDYGYMYIDGEYRGKFPWNGEFVLTENAKPGDRFFIAIRAMNTGGPLRLISAQIESENTKPVKVEIENLILSLRTAQKLLSFDTYQTNSRVKVDPGTDKSKMDREEKEKLYLLLQQKVLQLNLDDLRKGKSDQFLLSVNQLKNDLSAIRDFSKRFTLYFSSNAHIDAAWLWRSKETIEVAKNTFSSVLNMMDSVPHFTYSQSAAAYYDWMENMYPDIYRNIKKRVEEGRWEITGGMWIEPDCNLISGESWMRQLLYAKKYFRTKFGKNIKLGWNPDSFGYNWNMPMFYNQARIESFITQKIGWNEVNVFPHRVFWWESPDGSRLFTYFPFDYVNEITEPFKLIDWLRQYEANTGYSNMMVLFGVGDHGGGPSMEMLGRIERLKNVYIYPNIIHGTAENYINWLQSQDLSQIPVWKDELYLEYHQGTFTTQGETKKSNRMGEVLLTNTEKFSTFATLTGRSVNKPYITSSWKKVLFNQFHDILPGSSIREVYIDAKEDYRQAFNIAGTELKNSLTRIAEKVNTSDIKRGITPILVFNSLNWERNDVVKHKLTPGEDNIYGVYDADGKEVASFINPIDEINREIIFVAEKVPASGYKVYSLGIKSKAGTETASLQFRNVIENEFFRVVIDSATGWIKNIFDKKNNREVLADYGNKLQLLEDRPSAWDAWNIGLTGTEFPTVFRNAEMIENNAVRSVIRLHRDYLKPGTIKSFPTETYPSSFFVQDVILYKKLNRIDFKTSVDWWESKTMLKTSFPVTVISEKARYEIPYGSIERSTGNSNSFEKAQYEVPSLKWVDLSDSTYGVSLLNNSKYGFDIKGNNIRMSLLRSPKWPDETADMGKHEIEYSLYPHAGTWETAQTVRKSYEYNYPLLTETTTVHDGDLPAEYSFIKLEPANLVLTTVKIAEDNNDWVIQFYETSGKNSRALIDLPFMPVKVFISNFLEEDVKEVEIKNNKIAVDVKKNSVVTLKIKR
jgi:alpha-mannosidase